LTFSRSKSIFAQKDPLIVSKPQTGTIFSFALFLLITVVVVTMNGIVILRDRQAAWYNYAVTGVLIPVGLFVLFRIFVQYKVLKLGNNQIQIDYPVLRKSKIYPLDQIDEWVENRVKTGKKTEYKELQVRFTDGRKIAIGHQEHTEYTRMVQYLAQKVARKKGRVS
jgi:hypothetical protein